MTSRNDNNSIFWLLQHFRSLAGGNKLDNSLKTFDAAAAEDEDRLVLWLNAFDETQPRQWRKAGSVIMFASSNTVLTGWNKWVSLASSSVKPKAVCAFYCQSCKVVAQCQVGPFAQMLCIKNNCELFIINAIHLVTFVDLPCEKEYN